jgi:hypothetical protein
LNDTLEFDPNDHRNPATSRQVYFVSDGGYAIKIGVGTNPESRLAGMQTGNAKKLKIVGLMRGSFELEGAIHRRFEASHIRGEWFKDTPELRAFIAKHRTDISDDDKPHPLAPPLRRRKVANDNFPAKAKTVVEA